jgi:hypothetical protein
MNRSPIRRTLLAAALAAAAVLGSVVAVAAAAPATPFCGITWGSMPKTAGTFSTAAVLDTRTGQHDCYDRLVVDFSAPAHGFDVPANGYSVGYVDQVVSQARGQVLPVAGGARLGVLLLANGYDIDTGVQTYPHATGDHVANLAGYRTLRDVVYGGSFEGYTTFGVGVRARLPFRVLTLAGPGGHSRIVIDVAHHW